MRLRHYSAIGVVFWIVIHLSFVVKAQEVKSSTEDVKPPEAIQTSAKQSEKTLTEEKVGLAEASDGKQKIIKSTKALWKAHVLRVKDPQKKINSLDLLSQKIPVYLITGDSIRPLVKLNMSYKPQGDWKLYVDKLGEEGLKRTKKLDDQYELLPTVNEYGERTIYAYLTSRLSTVTLVAKNSDGTQEESETFYVFAPEAREIKMVSILDSLVFYAGHTYFVYRQTSFGTFVAQSLLLGAKYLSPDKGRRFGYLGDASITVYTYASSPLERSPNFLEARAAGTYSANLFKDPRYRSRFSLGVSTVNLFSFGSPFGFSGLYGPNLGFRTEYFENAKNSFTGEIQITPYETDFLSERSVKLSVEWTRNIKNIRISQLGLSYASHKFTDGFEKINMDVVSVYFGLSF